MKGIGKLGSMVSWFVRTQDGVATVDWVVMCVAAATVGMIALNLGRDTMTDYSIGLRHEVQSPHFTTTWVQVMPGAAQGN